ncbi:hypothetical protein BC943DRAFT_327098 [Umbelopsis sp. AD052]|nr:hypothetical protein BC943DRAFT_327098 [Umbelopsis sp. AD052]
MGLKRATLLQALLLICFITVIALVWSGNDASKSNTEFQDSRNDVCLDDSDCVDQQTGSEADFKDVTDVTHANQVLDSKYDAPFTIVSGASANHFCALEAFLYSLHQLKDEVHPSQFPRIIVYNIGVNGSQYPVLEELQKANYFDELYDFDFPAYPDFWNIRAARGQYAWKAGIINEIQRKQKGVVLWMDSGNVPNAEFLRTIPDVVRKQGFWSPRSTGFMGGKLIHPGMFAWFQADASDYKDFTNCNGAALGFNLDDPRVVNELVVPWFECALELNCIAPLGSSRSNHRQDQAAITFLAYRSGYSCYEYPEFHGITIHQDVKCRERLGVQASQGKLIHPSSYDYPEWTPTDTSAMWRNPEWWTRHSTPPPS